MTRSLSRVPGHGPTWLRALALAGAVNAAFLILLPMLARETGPPTAQSLFSPPVRLLPLPPATPPAPRPRPELVRPCRDPALVRPNPVRPMGPADAGHRPHLPGLDYTPVLATEAPGAATVAVPAPPAPARASFEAGEVDARPVPLRQVRPEYPFRARSRNLSGTVLVRFLVDGQGLVRQARVLAADPPNVFEKTVLRAVRLWRFKPGLLDGQPVATWMELPVRFDISE